MAMGLFAAATIPAGYGSGLYGIGSYGEDPIEVLNLQTAGVQYGGFAQRILLAAVSNTATSSATVAAQQIKTVAITSNATSSAAVAAKLVSRTPLWRLPQPQARQWPQLVSNPPFAFPAPYPASLCRCRACSLSTSPRTQFVNKRVRGSQDADICYL